MSNVLRCAMAVPRMSQLRSGVAVNIVQKADQPSGRLTHGHIADILTRGDHPRGIKVRLTSGQIGRVQSLSSDSSVSEPSLSSTSQDLPTPLHHQQQSRRRRRSRNRDPPSDYLPLSDRADVAVSLLDYVKAPRAASTRPDQREDPNHEIERSSQEQLESEFPNIDPALIAAIVLDNPQISEARRVLALLAEG